LVIDDAVDDAMGLFRSRPEAPTAEAAVIRLAVMEGTLMEAIIAVASGGGADSARAVDLVVGVRSLLPDLPLPGQAKAELMVSLNRALVTPSASERKLRQLALLEEPHVEIGQTAQDLADTFDAFERLPSS
jgi:hypothetical protein